MANASVVDELIVRITLDSSQYKKADAEVDREGSGVQYKITVANGDRTQDIKIDGNGQVSRSK